MGENTMEKMFELIKSSLWQTEINQEADYDIYNEMQKHNVLLLPAGILMHLSMPEELRKEWKRAILRCCLHQEQYKYTQDNIPLSVPYAILKGTSASQYYPCPEYRIMGDIDIITKREDFDQAYEDLLNNGFSAIKNDEREITLVKESTITKRTANTKSITLFTTLL